MLSNFSKRRHPGVGRCRSRCIEVSKKEFVNILYKLIGSIKKWENPKGHCRRFGWQGRRSRRPRQRRTLTHSTTRKAGLPATRNVLLLHLSAGRDGEGGAGDQAGARVHDGDGVAGALRQRLVQLHMMLLEACRRRVERIVGARQEKCGGGLDLLLQGRAFG